MVVQNPRRKERDEGVSVMVRMSSANSAASACCTSGLSDIQKPEQSLDYKLSKDISLTVEYALPEFCHILVKYRMLRI